MKITKLGHCCLIIESKDTKVLTDPGEWNELPQDLIGIDAILITHEHSDHLHTESVKKILSQNPSVQIYCNSSVSKILSEQVIPFKLIEDQEIQKIKDIIVKAFESPHAMVYEGVPQVLNTSFLIDEALLIPGDNLFEPGTKVKILALPVAGPWLKLSEAIDYAKRINPKHAFPVHDGILKYLGPSHVLPELKLGELGIKFHKMNAGDIVDFDTN